VNCVDRRTIFAMLLITAILVIWKWLNARITNR
jgi:hypothetical protein